MALRHIMFLAALLALMFICIPVFAAQFAWIEGENLQASNIKVNVAGWGRTEYLSKGQWLHVSIDADKVEAEVPAVGGQLSSDFTLESAGSHEVWARIGFEFVRSEFEWRIDEGDWKRVKSDELTIDLIELSTWCEVAWLKLDTTNLNAGKHKLEIRLPRVTDDKDTLQRVLFACDAICIFKGEFHPNSFHKPDDNTPSARDEEAARKVFVLPETDAAGRSEIALNGLWEVCRNDEQLPVNTAEPMTDFPKETFWSAILVPGDKNNLRPDLRFAHRLWYRTKVNVPISMAGKSCFIEFPMNNLNTTVMVNGKLCGFAKSPFARIQIDLTQGIKPGQVNEIYVGIRDAWYGFSQNPNDPMKLRRMFNLPLERAGSGFLDLAYPVWSAFQSGILGTPKIVAAGGVYAEDVFCKPSVSQKKMLADVTLKNNRNEVVAGEIRWSAVNQKTNEIEKTFAPVSFNLAAGESKIIPVTDGWENPKLWWPEPDAQMYWLRTQVVIDGKLVDVADTSFGFREWSTAGKDFKLNGIVWHGWADCHSHPNKEEWLSFYRSTNQRFTRLWKSDNWQGMTPVEALEWFDRNGVVIRRSGMLDGQAIGYFAVENDPDLRAKYNSPIKMELMENWKTQICDWVKGERNHPSVMLWSMENEWLYINCINLYGDLMDQFEAVVTDVANAVQTVDPTRSVMCDGGGATKAQTLPVHGDHYVAQPGSAQYPALAYSVNATGGGRGRWVWDENRPRFIGEDVFAEGHNPAYSMYGGEDVFLGQQGSKPAVGLFAAMLSQGYRWAEYGAWQLWQGQGVGVGQYDYNAPLIVLTRDWDWTFGSGQTIKRTFGIFNDTRFSDPVTFTWILNITGQETLRGGKTVTVPAGENLKWDEEITLPQVDKRTEAELILSLQTRGTEAYRGVKQVSLLPAATAAIQELPGLQYINSADLLVCDPTGTAKVFLTQCGLAYTEIASLNELPDAGRVLLIGRNALDEVSSATTAISAWVSTGGRRVVVLEQEHPLKYQGLPAQMEPAKNEGRIAFIEDTGHPVIEGLQNKDFFTWAPDELLYHNVYLKPQKGGRSIIQCHELLKHTALVEVPVGAGTMLVCQLAVGEKLAENAVAQQLLLNMLEYATTYKQEFRETVAFIEDAPELKAALDGIGLQYTETASALDAINTDGAKLVIINATPEALAQLAANKTQVDAFIAAGGYIVFNGLTPEGLADYNQLVEVDHLIRPFKRERVTLAAKKDTLGSGLSLSDVALYSSEQIFPWRAGNYVASDTFNYVVDYDEVAPFASSTFFAYDNITNGFVSADGWPLIINFPKNEDDTPFDVPIHLPRPEKITELTWIGNNFYYPQTQLHLIFDGKQAEKLTFDIKPTDEPQLLPLEPGQTAQDITLQIAKWEVKPDIAPNIGIDNISLKVYRTPEFYEKVRPLLNVGGLVHYPRGKGGLVLANLLFKDNESVPENAAHKRNALATILHNLKAPFAGGKEIIAGANLTYEPVDLSHTANQYRTERGWFGDAQFTFKDLPTGNQRLAGVLYDIYDFPTSPVPTCLMLGPGVPNNLAEEIRGIAVNRKADALFFLHTAKLDWRRNEQEVREGKQFEMARYIVHYADGQTVGIPIYAEIDIDNWRQNTPNAIAGAQIAWVKQYEGTDQWAVAYSKQWVNPRPDIEISSIDLVYGNDRRGNPALLALTVASAKQ